MKKSLLILLASFSVLFFSCEQNSTEPEIEEPKPIDEIVGMYDAKEYIWYIYNQGGGSGDPQIHNEVLEVRKASNGNDYDLYLDGYWNAKLNFDRVYDGVLYCTISEHGGYWSSSNTLYDRTGWNSLLADYTASEVTFQMNKNNKLEVCMRYYNLRHATTGEPDDYWIIVYYEGNRR